MSRTGWWTQLKTNRYPKTKTDYGDAFIEERPERNRPARPSDFVIALECMNCGRQKPMTAARASTIREKLGLAEDEPLKPQHLRDDRKRFRCTSCHKKGEPLFILGPDESL